MSKPLSDFARYDRIVDWQGKLYRAQIKYVSCAPPHCSGAVQLNLRKNGGQFYSRDEIDVLLVYVAQTDCLYWFGPEVFHEGKSLQIRFEPTRNSQIKGCLMAENYLWYDFKANTGCGSAW